MNIQVHTLDLVETFRSMGAAIQNAKTYGDITKEQYSEAAREYWRLFYLSGEPKETKA